jgi:hypothetical protein
MLQVQNTYLSGWEGYLGSMHHENRNFVVGTVCLSGQV